MGVLYWSRLTANMPDSAVDSPSMVMTEVSTMSAAMMALRLVSSPVFTKSSVSCTYCSSVTSRLYVVSRCIWYASSNMATSATSASPVELRDESEEEEEEEEPPGLPPRLTCLERPRLREPGVPRCSTSRRSPCSVAARENSMAVRLSLCMSSSSCRNFSSTSLVLSTRVVSRVSRFLERRTSSRSGAWMRRVSFSSAGITTPSTSRASPSSRCTTVSRHTSSTLSSNDSPTGAWAPPVCCATWVRRMSLMRDSPGYDMTLPTCSGLGSLSLSSAIRPCAASSSGLTTSTYSSVMMHFAASPSCTTMARSRSRMAGGDSDARPGSSSRRSRARTPSLSAVRHLSVDTRLVFPNLSIRSQVACLCTCLCAFFFDLADLNSLGTSSASLCERD
mmetsp:Transcript_368/g.954  ORF Transcript_368/g.954 Transcript_368/m.954 type:complete len:391 (+) Transcript_368:2624-3796(+)